MIRAVIDTNVLVSGLLSPAGNEALIVLAVHQGLVRPWLGNRGFRATSITAYLRHSGTLEKAAQVANHASTRTTQLYDRRREELSLNEVERVRT